MKVVLDEGVPRQMVEALRECGIDAFRFPRHWSGMANGQLIVEVEASGFDVLLTNDKNIADQRSLNGRRVAVVALPHNKRRPIVARAGDIADTIKAATPGQHIVMQRDGSRMVKSIVNGEEVMENLPQLTPFASDLT